MDFKKMMVGIICCPLFCLLLMWSSCPSLLADQHFEEKAGAISKTPEMKIRLGRSHFDPLATDRAATVRHFQQSRDERTAGMGYFIVQFNGPVQQTWKDALVQNGVEILDYVPDFAFSVRMESGLLDAVRAMKHVRWVGPYRAQYRISSGALEQMYVEGGKAEVPAISLKVILFAGSDINTNQAAIQALGGFIEDISDSGRKITLQVTLPADAIDDLSAIEDIKWIEKAPQWRLHNSESTDIIDARIPRDEHDLYGEGQVVAVSDTGLDTGDDTDVNFHLDFEDGAGGSRVDQIIDLSLDGASDDYSSHGTHVVGSVLGNGDRSGSDPTTDNFPDTSFAGVAPKARLVFQAIESTEGNLSGIPGDLTTLFNEAQTAGAHLHTNSWGQPTASIYTSGSQDVDQYMWDNKEYLIVYSAGSNGVDLDGDGVIDEYRIDSPATAKNCLTVGASEGYQPSGAGYDFNWGDNVDLWLNWFGSDPIASDHVSDNQDGMAAISARGPTLDGRTKPDLVAPGSNILSTRSSVAAGTGWGAYDSYYMWNGGTSTSAPLTAGAAALMRQYLMDVEGITTPSAALIKAALINSADDMSPGQYGGEIPQAPNSVEGWGRLNLGNALYPDGDLNILYYDENTGLAASESEDYVIQVTNAGAPLKINLVWTDYPGNPAAQGQLVNDLDLQVTDPSLAVHYPDNAAQKSTIETIDFDDDSYTNSNLASSHAMRFNLGDTSDASATYLDSVSFAFYNNGADGGATGSVDVVVYGDNAGRPNTGVELFRKPLSFVPWTMITIPINLDMTGYTDFHIAIEETDTTNLGLYVDNVNPSGDRSSYSDDGGTTWLDSAITPYIRANMRAANVSADFDRVNNAVGVTIDTPTVGEYTIQVSGFNVPSGPQPYALIAMGNIADARFGTVQFDSATYSVDETGTTATITVTRTGGRDGAISVDYATSDGSATAGSDYTAASGTLSWADGVTTAQTFTVTIADDSTEEGDETINLTLSVVGGNAALGAQDTAVLTIVDDDNDSGGGGGSSGGGGCFIQNLK